MSGMCSGAAVRHSQKSTASNASAKQEKRIDDISFDHY